MAELVLFHSAYGLRPAVRAIGQRLRALGHRVEIPDLYDGRIVDDLTEGLALRDSIGRQVLLERARAAVASARRGTVLAGFSLGAALAHRVAAADDRFDHLLLLHGVAEVPPALPRPWVVQAHVANDDEWAPLPELDAWRSALEGRGATVDLHLYEAAGHLFTDPDLPDYEARAASATWRLAEEFLARASAHEPCGVNLR